MSSLLTGVDDVAMGCHLHHRGRQGQQGLWSALELRHEASPAPCQHVAAPVFATQSGPLAFTLPHPVCAAGTSRTRAPHRPAPPSCARTAAAAAAVGVGWAVLARGLGPPAGTPRRLLAAIKCAAEGCSAREFERGQSTAFGAGGKACCGAQL